MLLRALLVLFPVATFAQSMQCVESPQTANLLRRAGLAELVSDIVLHCTGGVPSAPGATVRKADLRISASAAPLASRVTAPGFSEALLLIDEPHSSANPSIPLLVCGTTGAPEDGTGSCPVTAAGATTYNGSPGRPNVFQGRVDGSDIVFRGVPLEPPAAGSTRVLRIVNIRVRGASVPLGTPSVKMSLSLSPATVASIPAEVSVGTAQDLDLTFTVPPPVSLPVCVGANVNGFQNPPFVLPQFSFTVREGFRSAWLIRNAGYPSVLSQNVTGFNYETESGFSAGATGQANPGSGTVPALTDPFPSFRGLNLAGAADAGTRIAIEYANIPQGARIFMQSAVGAFRIISPAPVTGATSPPELPVTLGKATAILELAEPRPYMEDAVEIRTSIAFLANTVSPASIQVKVGFVPADSTSIPRFADNGFVGAAFNLQPCTLPEPVDAGVTISRNHAAEATARNYSITVSNYSGTISGTVTVAAQLPRTARNVTLNGTGWTCGTASCSRNDALPAGSAFPPIILTGTMSHLDLFSVGLSVNNDNTAHNNIATDFPTDPVSEFGYRFVPANPCRVADTRNAVGRFGGPSMGPLTTRDFPIALSACGIPTSVRAVALNITVVPKGPFGYLSIWPTGRPQPTVSTLNSLDGRIKANAAIVPTGPDGSVSVFVTDAADVIIDINGYFPFNVSDALYYFPLTPCRILDTRNANGPLGGPALVRNANRTIPVRSSPCSIPPEARAYSLNATVVPRGPFGFLSMWPTGSPQPVVSTLNALTGAVTANAAIIPAGTNGSIEVFGTDQADLVLDINGYFASSPVPGGLSLYLVQPYRIVDTRVTPNGPFSGPAQAALVPREYPAGSAWAYSLNATVVPNGPLGFLTLWPSEESRPTASTLNAVDGSITSNAAIIKGGTRNLNFQAFTTETTHLIIDVNGIFRP